MRWNWPGMPHGEFAQYGGQPLARRRGIDDGQQGTGRGLFDVVFVDADLDRFNFAAKRDTKVDRVLRGIERQIRDFTEGTDLPVE